MWGRATAGALAGFGGLGWLAGLLTLVMYGVVLLCVRHLVMTALMPRISRS